MQNRQTDKMQTFRGRINPNATDLKQEKLELSKRAQNFFRYNGKEDKEPNVLVYKIDDSKCVVIDTDDKNTNDYVENLIEKFGIKMNRTPSISNIFAHDEKENKYKFHYWFKTNSAVDKMLGVNKTNLDILTKELVFEAIGYEHDNEMPNLADTPEFFPSVLRIPNPNQPPIQMKNEEIGNGMGAMITFALQVAPDPELVGDGQKRFHVEPAAPELQQPASHIEEQKAWIDKNTKAVEARTYKTWSETMFKIHNKYGNNNIGRALAHHFSKKDKDGYNAQNVDYFWNHLKTDNIKNCVFGITDEQREAMRDALFESFKTDLINMTKINEKKHKEEEKKTKNSSNENSFEIKYNAVKKEFEKTHFLNIATSCYVQECDYDDERKLILRNKTELGVAFQHLKVHFVQWNTTTGNYDAVTTAFIGHWVEDENIKKYQRMDTFPCMEDCPKDVYNLWTPFRISKIPMPKETEEIKKGVAFLRNHLSIMCNHEPTTLAELERWIAHLIQFAQHKSYMPIFQSDEGAGKGSFCELMRALLGKSKVILTSSPDEYVWGRFNNLMETAYLVFMDEINRFMTGTGLDKIKNVVTEPTIQLQHKGKGAYTMKSNHRFASLTNAWDGGMPVNKKARRFLMCEMSNEKIGNMDYFNKFYELLKNDNVLRAFYEHYATQKDVPPKLPPPIQTEFQKQMAELTVDVPTLWLRDFIGDAKINKKTFLQNKETSTMYKIINKQTKTEFINGKFETTEIADSGDYIIELYGKNTFEKVMEWAKKNGYEKYETTPIKISVYLSKKKWSGLKKGRVTNTGNTMYFYVDTLAEMLDL